MARRVLVGGMVALALGGVMACTSGGDGEGGAGNSGVNPQKLASDATVDDAMDVCMAVVSQQTVQQECESWAVQETDDPETCRDMRDRCALEEAGDSEDCDGAEIQSGLANCDGITIGEIESCFKSYIQAQNALSCDKPLGREMDMPACFLSMAEACPGLFDEEDGGEGSQVGSEVTTPGGPSGSLTCGGDDIDATDVDCEAFCAPVVGSGCVAAPTMEECVWLCGEAKSVCPNDLVHLSGCAAFEDVSWVCRGDDLDLEGGCQPELACFGGCIDEITMQ